MACSSWFSGPLPFYLPRWKGGRIEMGPRCVVVPPKWISFLRSATPYTADGELSLPFVERKEHP